MTYLEVHTKKWMGAHPNVVNVISSKIVKDYDYVEMESLYEEIMFM